MTSFTKALYRRDPAAAEEFYRQQQFEQKMQQGRPGLTYGRHATLTCFTVVDQQSKAAHGRSHGFELAHHPVQRTFGKRPQPPLRPDGRPITSCTENCGHPACTSGCVAR